MKLTKMHGLGNDFILFSDSQGANKDYTDLAIRLCDRRTGIGADGLVIVVPSNTCDVRMRIINSDGSEAEMCGNGIRCFAKYAYEHGEITKDTFTIETLAGHRCGPRCKWRNSNSKFRPSRCTSHRSFCGRHHESTGYNTRSNS